MVKWYPDYEDKDGNTRKYTYNDGIIYMFDNYGDMLEEKYNKDLEIQK